MKISEYSYYPWLKEEIINDKIDYLCSIFSNIDREIIESVFIEESNYDIEEALKVLLIIGDDK